MNGKGPMKTGVLQLTGLWSKPQLCKRASGHTTHLAGWRDAGCHAHTCECESCFSLTLTMHKHPFHVCLKWQVTHIQSGMQQGRNPFHSRPDQLKILPTSHTSPCLVAVPDASSAQACHYNLEKGSYCLFSLDSEKLFECFPLDIKTKTLF